MEPSNNQTPKYPSNSYSSLKPNYSNLGKGKEANNGESAKPKPIAKGREKKKTVGQRIADAFLMTTGDDIREYMLYDWLIPGVKSAVSSIVNMILYGGRKDDRVRRSGGESRIVNYNSYYGGGYSQKNRERPATKPSHRPEIEFDTRQEAEDVLTRMFDYVSDYGRASMKDLYSLCDMETTYAMADVGWRSLEGARVVQVGGGKYVLEMPKVEELRR